MALLQIGKSRQGEIYLNGFNGVQPSISTNGKLLEEKARKILNKKLLDIFCRSWFESGYSK